MAEQGKVWDGQREWTYVELAENEQHLRFLIEDHSPDTNSGKTYCPVCDRRAPCDITTLAATALAALSQQPRSEGGVSVNRVSELEAMVVSLNDDLAKARGRAELAEQAHRTSAEHRRELFGDADALRAALEEMVNAPEYHPDRFYHERLIDCIDQSCAYCVIRARWERARAALASTQRPAEGGGRDG